MSSPRDASSHVAATRYLPWLLLLFAGSGCAALIYEVVWYQLLQLVIGSTTISLGVLLAVFMGGLCLGSIYYPRLAARSRHPLKMYAWLELAIAASALLVLVLVPLVDHIYVAAVGYGLPAILLRALIAGLCLLPPTLLMGASLPALSRWFKATPRGVAWLGGLYAANTAGAVFGCLLAAFYLLPQLDMTEATLLAALINVVVGTSTLVYANRHSDAASAPEEEEERPAPVLAQAAAGGSSLTRNRPNPRTPAPPPPSTDGARAIYIAIALSGLTALGAEVIWTRLLSLLLGPTVYTFSLILAVFLFGLALGSGAGAAIERWTRPRLGLGICQWLLAGAIFWTAWMVTQSLPYWPVDPLLSTNHWMTLQLDLVRVLWAVLPPALLWGASFPLALAAAPAPQGDSGSLVGRVYAANTAGAIVGALGFSIVLIPWIGSQNCQRLLVLLAVVSGMVVLAPLAWRLKSLAGVVALAASVFAGIVLTVAVAPVPADLVAFGRRIMLQMGHATVLATIEGRNSMIAYSRWEDGAIQFHVAGKVEASTEPYDMRLQRTLGDMPALVHPDPKTVLVVGFGAGVTAGSFTVYPSLQRLVVCEIEPQIPPNSTRFFEAQNYDVMHNPLTHIVYDDARAFVPTTREHFDIITSDPIHPWVKGSATLYTREYFETVKAHLNPGGIVTQWVPLYESDAETVRSEIATFFQVFPDGTIWANDINGEGYDVFLMGSAEPMQINVDQMQARLSQPSYANVAASLRDVNFNSAIDLLSTYAGQAQDLAGWLQGAEINTDSNLRLQYIAGLALNESEETDIYNQILANRHFPANLFTGSPEMLDALRARLQAPAGSGQ